MSVLEELLVKLATMTASGASKAEIVDALDAWIVGVKETSE